MNFISELNMLAVCEAFGYTEDEYNSNSIEFNIMAGMYLDAKSRASRSNKAGNGGAAKSKLPKLRTSIKR